MSSVIAVMKTGKSYAYRRFDAGLADARKITYASYLNIVYDHVGLQPTLDELTNRGDVVFINADTISKETLESLRRGMYFEDDNADTSVDADKTRPNRKFEIFWEVFDRRKLETTERMVIEAGSLEEAVQVAHDSYCSVNCTFGDWHVQRMNEDYSVPDDEDEDFFVVDYFQSDKKFSFLVSFRDFAGNEYGGFGKFVDEYDAMAYAERAWVELCIKEGLFGADEIKLN